MSLTKLEADLDIISKLEDEPNDTEDGLSADDLKARFDAAGKAIQAYLNKKLILEIEKEIENLHSADDELGGQIESLDPEGRIMDAGGIEAFVDSVLGEYGGFLEEVAEIIAKHNTADGAHPNIRAMFENYLTKHDPTATGRIRLETGDPEDDVHTLYGNGYIYFSEADGAEPRGRIEGLAYTEEPHAAVPYAQIQEYVAESIAAAGRGEGGDVAAHNESTTAHTYIRNQAWKSEPVPARSTDGVSYTASVAGVTSLYVGLKITVVPDKASTSLSPTLNLNGLGAKMIRLPAATTGASQMPSSAGFLAKGRPVDLEYSLNLDGTENVWKATSINRASASAINWDVTLGIAKGGTGRTSIEDTAPATAKYRASAIRSEANKVTPQAGVINWYY